MKRKLSEEALADIRRRLDDGESQYAIARDHPVTRGAISAIKLGRLYDPMPAELRKKTGPTPRPLAERFLFHVDQAGECWLWKGAQTKGYGAFALTRSNPEYAHRVAYTLWRGPIPKGQVVRHKCDTPLCVNPAHLELGTVQDNHDDMKRRNRPPGARKLTPEQVLEIRVGTAAGVTAAALSRRFGVAFGTIRSIQLGKTWRPLAEQVGA